MLQYIYILFTLTSCVTNKGNKDKVQGISNQSFAIIQSMSVSCNQYITITYRIIAAFLCKNSG